MKKPTERFFDRVENYVRYRPAYPDALLHDLIECCGLDESSAIADVGSGTGIFTRQLLDKQLSVSAIEPNAEMRRAAEAILANYRCFQSGSGSAEATKLGDSSIDLITVAQAFHWFDRDAAIAEFKRILKPHGQLALIWNRRDLNDPFQQAYENMLLELAPDYNVVNHMSIKDEQLETLFDKQSYQQKTFEYLQTFDCDQFLGRMQSSSYSPAKASQQLSELKRSAITLFEKFAVDGRIKFLYSSHLYLGRPRFYTWSHF